MADLTERFGTKVFSESVMKRWLPKDVYKKLAKTIEEGEPLGTLDIFDANGTPVASLPLLAGESIPHLTWSELFCRLLKLAYCGA